MKRLLLFSALVLSVAGVFSVSPKEVFAQNRHIFIEEFTGSWCGWCPRGAYAIEQLRAKYPGQVFATSIHVSGGDPMENLQGDSLSTGVPGLSTATAIPGFPSGWVQRLPKGTSWVSDPMDWYDSLNSATGIVDKMLNQPAEATVAIENLSYDPATNTVTAKVTATAVSALTGDIRVNLIVSQDSVSGPAGSLYDQHNYYAGNATYPKSPFYGQASVIPGFQHMQVYRMSVGGVWGTPGVVPNPAPAGKYSITYTFKLPASALNQDPNQLHFTALVHRYSTTDAAQNGILDAADARLHVNFYGPKLDIAATDGPYTFAKSNGDTSKTITYSNSNAQDVVLKLSVNSAGLPAGWTATVSPATLTVPANGFADATLTYHAPEQSAFVGIVVNALPSKEGFVSDTMSTPIFALSSNTRSAILTSNTIDASIFQAIPASVRTHMALLPLNGDVLGLYPISGFDLAIFDNPQFIDQDGFYTAPPASLQTIEDLLTGGKKVFLTSDLAMVLNYNTTLNGYSHINTPAATSFFEDTLGITYRTSDNHVSGNSYLSFPIKPTADPIVAGVPALVATGSQFTAPFDVTGANSKPLFYFDNKATNNGGIRYTNPQSGGKLVYLGFNLQTITVQKWADTIASRSIAWLLGGASGVAPVMANNASLAAYPNPFSNLTNVQYAATSDENNVTFSVVNLLGQEIEKLSTKSTGNVYSASFDASALSNGTYVIVAHSSKGTHEVRVVTQH